MFRAPQIAPADPQPCTARPIINIIELREVAQMTEPALLLLAACLALGHIFSQREVEELGSERVIHTESKQNYVTAHGVFQ